jgi:hypothetical protein
VRFDPKAELHEYLQSGRRVLLWKLDGLSEYDIRRPRTPTGTNLLGLVQHTASTESGYFGLVFGRPFPEPLPWQDGRPNGDMWVRPDQTRDDVLAVCRRVWAHADATIAALPLDTVGEVPWWPEGDRELSLHQAMVHVLVDVARHSGHADILRETIDGTTGMDPRWPNVAPGDEAWWQAYCDQVEDAARRAGDRA